MRLRLVDVADDGAFAGIADLHEIVWGRRDGHTQQLREELRRTPGTLDVFVAEATEPMEAEPVEAGSVEAGGHRVEVGQIVCGARVRYSPGTDFCSLWGGTTHPAARRRRIYRALVAQRAQRASERGFPFVRVDCSPDSLPILTRTGWSRLRRPSQRPSPRDGRSYLRVRRAPVSSCAVARIGGGWRAARGTGARRTRT